MTTNALLADYKSLLHLPLAGSGYAALPADFVAKADMIRANSPMKELSLNRSLTAELCDDFSLDSSPFNLPIEIQQLYGEQIDRLRRLAAQGPEDHFSLNNDIFRKDLGIFLHRFIPCGAEFFTPHSGVARRLLFSGGLRQGWHVLQTLYEMRGNSPLLELHMHPHVLERFNPDGWRETYDNLANFLHCNQEFRGVQSTSWFLDPALSTISPHLAYLREVPEAGGACIAFNQLDDGSTSGALETSKTRQSLHDKGLYSPKLYTRIWPRARVLKRPY